MKTLILALGCVLTLAVPAAAQNADITGTWDLTIVTPQGGQPAPLVLRMDGAKIVGTIKGTAIEFALDMNAQGNIVHIVYSGVVDKDSVKGTVTLGDFGDGTFTGKKK